MNRSISCVLLGASVFSLAGCRNDPPPPRRADIPPVGVYSSNERMVAPKPLPAQDAPVYQPPFDDVPLVTQAPPEQEQFVKAYAGVGNPRITLFVNRSLEGQIIPTNPGGPIAGVQNTRETTSAMSTETTRTQLDRYGRPVSERSDRFETQGPAKLTDRTEVYLSPGQYDEVAAKRVDYDAVENVMTDWLAGGGRVSMISPKLSESQIKEIQKGSRNVLNELSKDNQIDVLIQVQAHATRQTQQGLEVRLVAEAINTAGGESIGRAFVDVPPPLEKTQINEYTRFLARKLMSDMTRTWSNPRPAPRTSTPPVPPTTQP